MKNSVSIRATQKDAKIPNAWVKKVLRFVLNEERNRGEISVFFTNEEEMAELNLRYRKRKGPTDVLAFPVGTPAAAENLLGDVVISIPTAYRQALEAGHSLLQEVTFLLIHGVLHLLGYDHHKARERKIMFAKQNNFLERLVAKDGR